MLPAYWGCGFVAQKSHLYVGIDAWVNFWGNREVAWAKFLFAFCKKYAWSDTTVILQVTKPPRGVPRVFVNRTRPGSTGFVGWIMGLGRSVKFDEPNDLILLGDCDQQVREICDRTGGWRRELDSLQVEVMEP